ncbi:MAG: ClpXP protease specificity-enhancing factor SspB [Xanthobacteraceae bacterium]
MAVDHIRYDILAQQALRGVVRTVLADVSVKGLPGEHHFKITFATPAAGVRLSDRMRAQYPETMTVILQHQFWDLIVGEESFEVGLSFGGVPERLAVPFDAITAFFDPAVQFGFQFETLDAEASDGSADAGNVPETAALKPGTSAETKTRPLAEPGKPDALPAPAAGAKEQIPGTGGGEVVRLDRFRKK